MKKTAEYHETHLSIQKTRPVYLGRKESLLSRAHCHSRLIWVAEPFSKIELIVSINNCSNRRRFKLS